MEEKRFGDAQEDARKKAAWRSNRRMIRLVWWGAVVAGFAGSYAAGLDLTRLYASLGLGLLFVAMVLDRTLVGGERARGEYAFDRARFDEEERKIRGRAVSAALFYAIPLLAMPLLYYFAL